MPSGTLFSGKQVKKQHEMKPSTAAPYYQNVGSYRPSRNSKLLGLSLPVRLEHIRYLKINRSPKLRCLKVWQRRLELFNFKFTENY